MAALAAKGVIDPARVCIVGASYGGYAALAGVTLQHGVYRCAVAVAGLSELGSRLFEAGGYSELFLQREFGQKWAASEALHAVSPLYHADDASAPILLIHGKDDTVVPLTQSEYMQTALIKAHKPVELVTLQGEDHNLARQDTRIQMLKASVSFVEAHNPANP